MHVALVLASGTGKRHNFDRIAPCMLGYASPQVEERDSWGGQKRLKPKVSGFRSCCTLDDLVRHGDAEPAGALSDWLKLGLAGRGQQGHILMETARTQGYERRQLP